MGSSQVLQRCGRKWASGLPKVYREPASSCAFRDKPVNSAKHFCIFHSPSWLIMPAFEKIMHRTGRKIIAIPVPEFGKIVWGRRPVRQGDPIPCGGNRNILKSGHEKAAGTVPFRPRSDENFPRFLDRPSRMSDTGSDDGHFSCDDGRFFRDDEHFFFHVGRIFLHVERKWQDDGH
ncbi:hypothetical protein [Caldibacillus debilis]|uniref:hypothetical protein n=1 Tax=Caldibacillus debilis TaxID=301148 RepID=UPI0023EFF78D|nr:hypothetical protein [Caldibacillus debilis]